jgi:glycosyl transferase family 25
LAFERVPAVDGRKLPREELANYAATHRRSVAWLPGDIGNSLSHIYLWQKIASGEARWTLVFEDDVSLSPLLLDFLDQFSKTDIPRSTLVKIETMGSNITVATKPAVTLGPISLHKLRTPHMGTGGYLIDRDAADALAKHHTILDDPIDAIWKPWLAKQINVNLLQAIPALVVQDDFDRRGKKLGLPSLVDKERAGRPRETRWAKFKRTVRDFPRRGIVIGRRQRIPFAG